VDEGHSTSEKIMKYTSNYRIFMGWSCYNLWKVTTNKAIQYSIHIPLIIDKSGLHKLRFSCSELP